MVYTARGLMKQNKVLTGSLCALGCETLYGLSYIFTRKATANAGELVLLSWRFLIAVIIVTILAAAGAVKIDLKNKPLKYLVAVAVFNPCIYFIAETFGISNTTASESGVFLACIPVVSLAASALALKKKPSKIQIAGILITLIGVIITVLVVSASSSLSIIGYVSLLIAVVSYAAYSVSVEKASCFTEAEITYSMLVSGAVLFVFLALADALMNGNIAELALLPFADMSFLSAVLYQGLGCSILAFFLSNAAISRIGVNRTSSFIGVSTVVSILAGAIFLHEDFSGYQIVGAAIIIAGVYIANAGKKAE